MLSKKKSPLQKKLSRIRLLAMDVDGVLSDGRVIYDDKGREMKHFHAHDGYGITRAIKLGLHCAIITGRLSSIVSRRGKELGIKHIYQGVENKLVIYNQVKRALRLTDAEICYIGDDEPDIVVLHVAGVSAAPADAVNEVRDCVDIVTRKKGGHGAVREVLDAILRAQQLIT